MNDEYIVEYDRIIEYNISSIYVRIYILTNIEGNNFQHKILILHYQMILIYQLQCIYPE